MKITALITIENSHVVGYEIDNENFIWLSELKEKLISNNIKLENAILNKFNHIEIIDEQMLPTHNNNKVFETDLLIYANKRGEASKQPIPAYFENAIFQYDYNDKPMKINPNYYTDFDQNSSKFKPLLYNNNEAIKEMRFLFKNISLTKVNVSNIDTQHIKDMTGMFNYVATNNLDLSTFDTYNVKTMRLMFSQCNILKLDLSKFNMTNVLDMSRMFANATIGELIMPKISVYNLKQATEIFEYAEIGKLDVTMIDLSSMENVKDFIRTLYNCQTNIKTIVYGKAHKEIQTLLTSNWANV